MKRVILCIMGILCSMCSLVNAKEINVLTSIKPLQLIATAILDGNGQPDVLLPPSVSPHHYTLRPSDIERIESADLFYWVGPNMELFLAKVLQRRTKPTVTIESLPAIELLHFTAEEAEHDEHDHDHVHQAGAVDPHLWLSIKNAQVIAQRMAADFSQLDPENKALYEKNLQQFDHALTSLNEEVKQHLQNVKLKPYFVFHETYRYFEHDYGLKDAGVFSLQGSVQPSARHVAEMRQRLQAAGESCVFYEPPVAPKLASVLTKDLPVKLSMLDALGNDIPVVAEGYPMLLKKLSTEFLSCKQ